MVLGEREREREAEAEAAAAPAPATAAAEGSGRGERALRVLIDGIFEVVLRLLSTVHAESWLAG